MATKYNNQFRQGLSMLKPLMIVEEQMFTKSHRITSQISSKLVRRNSTFTMVRPFTKVTILTKQRNLLSPIIGGTDIIGILTQCSEKYILTM